MATVLVAEDDRMILDMLVFTLEGAGHRVLTRTDGLAALEAARRERPDLVLLDIAMPGATGHEVCQSLRAEPGTAGLPVIMLTARAQWLDVSAGFDSGADDYLVKPFSPQELLERIEHLLSSTGQAGTAVTSP
jgi:DNA-binding response OmpR family regulator